MGALHAAALVASLRDRKAAKPTAAGAFMLSAALWSYATLFLALSVWAGGWFFLFEVLRLRLEPASELKFTMLLLVGSAIGSLGYWMFVQLFWFKEFRLADLIRTVTLCVAATLLTVCVGELLGAKVEISNVISDVSLTAVWWAAFSASLYWSEVDRLRQGTNAGGTTTSSPDLLAK